MVWSLCQAMLLLPHLVLPTTPQSIVLVLCVRTLSFKPRHGPTSEWKRDCLYHWWDAVQREAKQGLLG